MAKLVFRDFDEFAASLKGIEGRFVPTARGREDWWIESGNAGATCAQQFQIGSPVAFVGQGQSQHLTFALAMTDPGQVRIDGHQLEPDAFVLLHEDQPFTFSGGGVSRWAGVSVPMDTALLAPELLHLARSHRGPRTRTEQPYLDRLRFVASRAVANSDSIDSGDLAVTHSLQEELGVCMTHVVERSLHVVNRPTGRPQFARGRVIARTLGLIEAHHGLPLFIDDLCRATGVSERALRNIFHEYFGVGPMRLLKVRQLHEIRAALLRADPQQDTVTRIAAGMGIWDFSLFARNYKALFGEAPSRTLRTPPTDLRNSCSSISWLQYASRIFTDEDSDSQPPNGGAS